MKKKSKSRPDAICVVERQIDEFIANDTRLDHGRRLLLITGPNMGGKSTYMRQTALIVLLAHVGSFVPAKRAVIGPVDQIFTRIGASDDLAGGRSTFMVEMTEAANILHNATRTSVCTHGRGRSRYVHFRRHGAGDRHRPPSCGNEPELHAVRHPLLRAHPAGGGIPASRQRASGCGRAQGQDRIPARGRGRPGLAKLRNPGCPTGRRTGRGGTRGEETSGETGRGRRRHAVRREIFSPCLRPGKTRKIIACRMRCANWTPTPCRPRKRSSCFTA